MCTQYEAGVRVSEDAVHLHSELILSMAAIEERQVAFGKILDRFLGHPMGTWSFASGIMMWLFGCFWRSFGGPRVDLMALFF